jgi:hypothetical protein
MFTTGAPERRAVTSSLIARRVEGKAEALICLLVERFGPLEPALHGQICSASLASIETWFVRAIDASSLSSIFGAALSEDNESRLDPDVRRAC